MKIFVASAAIAAALIVSAPANAATIINVDGKANASLDGKKAVEVLLGSGQYNLTFTRDLYESFSRFASNSGCDSAGKNCVQGFENSIKYIINGVTYSLGDGASNGGRGPQDPGDGYFASSSISFANASQYSGTFALAEATTVRFFLYDDYLEDNRGGVSLSVSPVPEPATWAMMIGGFGMVGGAMRLARRRRKVSVAYA